MIYFHCFLSTEAAHLFRKFDRKLDFVKGTNDNQQVKKTQSRLQSDYSFIPYDYPEFQKQTPQNFQENKQKMFL